MLEKIIRWMIYLSILTTSFDIFLAVQLGGTVRFCQIILIIPYAYFIIKTVLNKKLIIPSYIKWLLIWSVFMLVFLINTDHMERTVGYYLWLMFNIMNIFVLVNLFFEKNRLTNLICFYGISFVLVALFGLFQFVSAPFLKLSTPLVSQWWIPGILARINGFSYEPSYFATYELIGWTFFFFLIRLHNDTLYSKKVRNISFIILTLAILFSSSRMGIAMVIAISTLSYVNNALLFFVNFRKGKIYFSFILKTIFAVSFIVALFAYVANSGMLDEYDFLLSGTGINGASSHSVDARSSLAEETFNIFLENPFIGVSLGGIPEHIAALMNMNVGDKQFEGSVVFLEVLAASGIFGIIPFLIYFIKVIFSGYRVFYGRKNTVGLSLMYALIAELIILQFNQNILRPYFWMHIAVLSVTFTFQYKVTINQQLDSKKNLPVD